MDQLAREAAEARAAGLSYGKWKALQKPKEDQVVRIRRRKKESTKSCEVCGTELRGQQRKYCCTECCNTASKRRKEQNAE